LRGLTDVLNALPCLIDCDLETMQVHAGDFTQADILEIGCGDGLSLRHLRQQGAKGHLLGIDLSEGMLAVARSFEQDQHPPIDYQLVDATVGEALGEFDLVIAPCIFSLAENREQLMGMFRTAGRSLRPGGRLVIYDENVFLSPEKYPLTLAYGYRKWVENAVGQPFVEGQQVHVRVGNENDYFDVAETYLPWDAWQQAALSAGLQSLAPLPIHVSAAGIQARGSAFWQNYVETPLALCLGAVKVS